MAKKKTGKKNSNPINLNAIGQFAADMAPVVGGVVGTLVAGPAGTAVGAAGGTAVKKVSQGKGKARAKAAIEARSRGPRGKTPARSGTPSKVLEKAVKIDAEAESLEQNLGLPGDPRVHQMQAQAARAAASASAQKSASVLNPIAEASNEFAAETTASDVGPAMRGLATKVDTQFAEVEGELDQVQEQTSVLSALITKLQAELDAYVASNKVMDEAQEAAIASAGTLINGLRDLQLQDVAALEGLYGRLRESGLVPTGKGYMEDLKNGSLWVGPDNDQVLVSIPTLFAAVALCLGGSVVVADADYTPELSLSLDMFNLKGSRVLHCGPHIVRVEQPSATPTNPKILGAPLAAAIKIKSSLVIATFGNINEGGVQTLDGNVWPGATSNDGSALLAATDGYISPTRGVFMLERRYQLFTTLDTDRLLKLASTLVSIGIAGPLWGTVLSLIVNPMIESYRTGKAAAMFSTSTTAAEDAASYAVVGTVGSGTIES